MKVTKEHYSFIKTEIQRLIDNKGLQAVKDHKEFLKTDDRVKDLNKRFRWDLFNAACLVPYTCDVLYPYVNDDHIDTALKRIIVDLKL